MRSEWFVRLLVVSDLGTPETALTMLTLMGFLIAGTLIANAACVINVESANSKISQLIIKNLPRPVLERLREFRFLHNLVLLLNVVVVVLVLVFGVV